MVARVAHSDAAYVVGAHHAQREGAVLPGALKHHALVEREETFHLLRIGVLHGKETTGDVCAIGEGDVGRGDDAVVVRGREVDHDAVEIVARTGEMQIATQKLLQRVGDALHLVNLNVAGRGNMLESRSIPTATSSIILIVPSTGEKTLFGSLMKWRTPSFSSRVKKEFGVG